MAEKELNQRQQAQLERARKAIAWLESAAAECDMNELPILTRGWSHAAKVLGDGLANQVRSFRTNALTNAEGEAVDKK